jgi:hypothetical protein
MRKFCLLAILVPSALLEAAQIHPGESASSYHEERFVLGTVIAVQAERSLITIREPDLLGHLRIRSNAIRSNSRFFFMDSALATKSPQSFLPKTICSTG